MHSKYIFIALAVVVVSCTERVELSLEESGEPHLVVFAEITNDKKAHELKLGVSAPYFYNKQEQTVSGAMVTISDGIRTTGLTEDKNRPGIYLTPANYAGKTGRTYKLNISNVDINNDGVPEDYSAETEMKPSAADRWHSGCLYFALESMGCGPLQ